jgi:peptide/nickel transport system ATP-binding protein/glutathione transport system ATP-binding protein
MAVVERIAHRIAVMFAGQVVEVGTAKSVLADPRHSYTKRLIAAVPAVERRKQHFAIDTTVVPSLVRPPGYEPPPAQWQEVGADHHVRLEA